MIKDPSGGSVETGDAVGNKSGNMWDGERSAGEAFNAFSVNSGDFIVGDSAVDPSGTQMVEGFLLKCKLSSGVEDFADMAFFASLGLTGANANCDSLCFVESPEVGTLDAVLPGSLLCRFIRRRGTFGSKTGLDFALPALDDEAKVAESLRSGTGGGFLGDGTTTSSDESTENSDDGESGRGSSTALSLPWKQFMSIASGKTTQIQYLIDLGSRWCRRCF